MTTILAFSDAHGVPLPEEKNSVSHRSRALRAMLELLSSER